MYLKDSPQTIQSMFNSIAHRYDLTNSILSFSFHKRWNRYLIKCIRKHSNPKLLLDLCSGTGDISYAYLKSCQSPAGVCLIDFSSEMLKRARKKICPSSFKFKHQTHFIEADVQSLPLHENYADAIAIAYGIRNVKNPLNCFKEAFRVLKPGSCIAILELTRPGKKWLRAGHAFYLRFLMPFFGKFLTNNQNAYEYLCNSIQTFVAPEQLETLLKEAGFIHVESTPLTGGIATIIQAVKP